MVSYNIFDGDQDNLRSTGCFSNGPDMADMSADHQINTGNNSLVIENNFRNSDVAQSKRTMSQPRDAFQPIQRKQMRVSSSLSSLAQFKPTYARDNRALSVIQNELATGRSKLNLRQKISIYKLFTMLLICFSFHNFQVLLAQTNRHRKRSATQRNQ